MVRRPTLATSMKTRKCSRYTEGQERGGVIDGTHIKYIIMAFIHRVCR
jgi:hypothetical protein